MSDRQLHMHGLVLVTPSISTHLLESNIWFEPQSMQHCSPVRVLFLIFSRMRTTVRTDNYVACSHLILRLGSAGETDSFSLYELIL
jgi:hypothetical protein